MKIDSTKRAHHTFILFAFSVQFSDDCGWCKRPVSLGSTEYLASPEGLIYCTESCFTQSRRASFKRAKTCDWCKHIRHAISYVDFQDGATQLQFCSDKCLNQYKMQIFCKETQAHLDMNPHLKEKGSSSTNALITPDLWLKDCRSRSVSPSDSDQSRSSTSPPAPVYQVLRPNSPYSKTQQRPIITVAPTSMLISRADPMPIRNLVRDEQKPQQTNNLSQPTRLMRKRRSQRLHLNAKHGGYRSVNQINGIGNDTDETRRIDPSRNVNQKFDVTANQQKPVHISDVEMERQTAAKKLLQSLESIPTIVNSLQRHQQLLPPPDLFPLNSYHRPQRRPFGVPQFGPRTQRPSPSSTENRLPSIDAIAFPFQQSPAYSAFQTAPLPPMTLLVPCPIIVPFPVPIPVPLPFESFLKAAKAKLDTEKAKAYSIHSKTPDSIRSDTNETSSMDLVIGASDLRSEPFVEQPLDFTKEAANQLVIGDPFDAAAGAHTDFESNNLHSDKCIDNKLPSKFNSRLHAKRSFSRESESNRPLRKRKRIIDSDYLLKHNI